MAADRTPPSMNRRPSIVTGGQTIGTAQLAATASVKEAPPSRSKTLDSPVSASTATIMSCRAGHERLGSRFSMTARRTDSGTVRAVRAARPSHARPRRSSPGQREPMAKRAMAPKPIFAAISPVASFNWSA